MAVHVSAGCLPAAWACIVQRVPLRSTRATPVYADCYLFFFPVVFFVFFFFLLLLCPLFLLPFFSSFFFLLFFSPRHNVLAASAYYEHFYANMANGSEFVEFAADNSDLGPLVDWAVAHDADARRIAQAGRRFYFEHLSAEQTLCYLQATLTTYAERQAFTPTVRDGMEPVAQPFFRPSACPCHHAKDEL